MARIASILLGVEKLVAVGAMYQVSTVQELVATLLELLNDPQLRARSGVLGAPSRGESRGKGCAAANSTDRRHCALIPRAVRGCGTMNVLSSLRFAHSTCRLLKPHEIKHVVVTRIGVSNCDE